MQRLQVVVPVGVVPPGRFSYTLGLIRSGVVGIHRCSFFVSDSLFPVKWLMRFMIFFAKENQRFTEIILNNYLGLRKKHLP